MRKIDIRRIKPSTAGNNQILSYSNVAGEWSATSNVILTDVTVTGNLVVNGAITFGNTSSAQFGDVSITGNLTVTGNTTYINTTELNIGDNLIVLNADLPGGTAPTQNAGIVINRGSSANVSLYWDETNDWFETTNGLSVVGDIVSSNVVYSEFVTANQGFVTYAGLTANGDVSANNLTATHTISTPNVSVTDTISIGATTVNSTIYTGTANSANYFGGQLPAYYTNATNIATGTVPTARLPAANTLQAGVVQLIDSTGNTSVTIAATANSVKAAYDMAVVASNNAAAAYSNAHNDAVDYAANAYSNAIAIAANASNITSGILDTARLPGTANIATAINVGSNLSINTSTIAIGNSTVNAVIKADSISLGSNLTVNSTVMSWMGGEFITVDVHATDYVHVGNNVMMNTTSLSVGNSTVYTLIQGDHVHANGVYITNVDAVTLGGNTASTLLAAADTAYSNAVSVAATDASSKAGTAYSNAVSTAATDASSKAGAAYANAIAYSGNAALAYANAVSTASADATSKADAAFANAIATSNASQAYANAIAYSGNSALAYANAVTFATTKSDAAYANAIAYSGNAALAYANAVAFSANADNISSGTLNTARLPATVNVATAINVGSNVNVNTSSIHVGNSISNVSIISTGIVFPDSTLQTTAPIGGSSNTQILFNDRGSSNGAAGLSFVYTTNTLTVGNTINTNNISTNTISSSNVSATGNVNVTDTLKLGANGVTFADGSTMTTAAIDPIAYAIALG